MKYIEIKNKMNELKIHGSKNNHTDSYIHSMYEKFLNGSIVENVDSEKDVLKFSDSPFVYYGLINTKNKNVLSYVKILRDRMDRTKASQVIDMYTESGSRKNGNMSTLIKAIFNDHVTIRTNGNQTKDSMEFWNYLIKDGNLNFEYVVGNKSPVKIDPSNIHIPWDGKNDSYLLAHLY